MENVTKVVLISLLLFCIKTGSIYTNDLENLVKSGFVSSQNEVLGVQWNRKEQIIQEDTKNLKYSRDKYENNYICNTK